MDIPYIILVIVTLALGLGAQTYVSGKLSKYSDVPLATLVTGAQAAEQMLAAYGIDNVEVKPGGDGEDFFDPKTNSITLSPEAFDKSTVTAVATACHEAGHAVQHAQGYTPIVIRTAIAPVASLCSQAWIWVFLAGCIFGMLGLIWVAIALYAGVLIFSLVTLPVEFNASRRAVAYMETINLPVQEQKGAFDVLRACALTYVAAALASALQLVYLLGRTRR